MPRLEVLGWWFSPFAPSTLPRPQALVGGLDPAAREPVLRYLRAGAVLVTFPEPSFCRFDCGVDDMGTRDLTDGTYVWPEGLAHYVERHAVRLPEAFVAHAVARGGEVAKFRRPKAAFGLYDRAPWLRWALAQGACPDLDGFEIPDDEVQERIRADLGPVPHAAILLCRGSTREVVLDIGDGALELRQLRAGGRAKQRFAGWQEWPVAGAVPRDVASPQAKTGPAGLVGLRPERKKGGVPMDAFLAGLRKQHGLDGEPGSGSKE